MRRLRGWGGWRAAGAACLLAGAVALATPGASEAQIIFGGGSFGGGSFGSTRVRPGDGVPDIPGGFTFCRLVYRSVRGDGSGNGWDTDFPNADRNLPTRLGELTPTPVTRWSHGEPGYAAVRPTDPDLFRCPFLYAADVGELGFNDREVELMREYLLKGGILWVDDYWGVGAWNQFAVNIQAVLPEYPIVELPLDHPLFSVVYDVPEVPQIPSIQYWRRNGYDTSELGPESRTPTLSAILDDRGRVLVIMTHNTDVGDGWEREAEDPQFFYLFSPRGYAVGVNIAVWAMTN